MKPTIGRIVLFHPTPGITRAAIVAYVHSDTMVNVAVFDNNGETFGQTSVQLVAPGQPTPEFGMYCEWPAHPVEQASKPVESVGVSLTVSKETADAMERLIQRLDRELSAAP